LITQVEIKVFNEAHDEVLTS